MNRYGLDGVYELLLSLDKKDRASLLQGTDTVHKTLAELIKTQLNVDPLEGAYTGLFDTIQFGHVRCVFCFLLKEVFSSKNVFFFWISLKYLKY